MPGNQMKVKQASQVGNASNRIWEAICVVCSLTLAEHQSEIILKNDDTIGRFRAADCFICHTPVKFFPTDEYEQE